MLKYPLILFLALIPVIFTAFYLSVSGKAFEQYYTYSFARDKKNKRNVFLFKRNISALLIFAASLFLIIALSSPVSFKEPREGLADNGNTVHDYSFAVDISNSMSADDGDVSRLENVKNSLISFIYSDRNNSRYSVTVFKGSAAVILPLTSDKKLVVSLIEKLSPDMFTSKGTAFYSAVESAGSVFPDHEKTYRTMVLFTDGEESEIGRFEKEIKKLAWTIKGEKIDTIIVMPDKSTGTVIPDSDNKHVSIPDFSLMEEAAKSWGGRILRISDFSASVFREKEYNYGEEKEYNRVFLFLSFLCLFFSFAAGRIKL